MSELGPDKPQAPRRGVDLDLIRQATNVQVRTTPATMRLVMCALVPGTLVYALLIDTRILLTFLVGMLAAVAFEALALVLRKRNVAHTVTDGSAALTGALIALSVSPLLPLWQLIVGVGIAILLAKHAYGGLGFNPFNPAMVGFAALLVSFPADMSHWPNSADPSLPVTHTLQGDDTTRELAGEAASDTRWDAVTAQTPRDRWREAAREQARSTDTQVTDAPLASHQSVEATPSLVVGWRWSSVAVTWLIGGVFLLWCRVISWHAPVAFLATLTLCHLGASLFSPLAFNPAMALLAGAGMFAAFFIITDPVSGAATARGRLVFGCGVGLLSFLIRQFGSWPEGLAFAVLIMNSAVPLIDRLDRPRQVL